MEGCKVNTADDGGKEDNNEDKQAGYTKVATIRVFGFIFDGENKKDSSDNLNDRNHNAEDSTHIMIWRIWRHTEAKKIDIIKRKILVEG